MPTITLPCLMSLFHSVEPSRHNIILDEYRPQVRPIKGIFEQMRETGKCCGMVSNWEPLRDLARPGNVEFSLLFSNKNGALDGNHKVTEAGIWALNEYNPDFEFVYLKAADSIGHKKGWMSKDYLDAVSDSWDSIHKIADAAREKYQIIVTAEHGGHDRMHGMDVEEDMSIPILLYGSGFEAGKCLKKISILDLAPTISELIGFKNSPEWAGHNLAQK